MTRSPISAGPASLASGDGPFQARVEPWMRECFGDVIPLDKVERGDRLIEEVFELLQSGGYDPARVVSLRDYVWGRPAGEPSQEVGGVMVTLAAYCLAFGLDMHEASETELARIWTKVPQIRVKQAAKPTGSALPIATAGPLGGPSLAQDPHPTLPEREAVARVQAWIDADAPPGALKTDGSVLAHDISEILSAIQVYEARIAELALERERLALALVDAVELAAPALTKRIAEVERERDEARYRPLGDNHHNAMACPYCNPDGLKPIAEARLAKVVEEMQGLASELNDAATTRQDWAVHPQIGGAKPRFAEHLKGKRYGYSHAAQLIRSRIKQAQALSELEGK